MGPGLGILFAILAVLVVLFVGSALLVGAVALANKTLGPVKADRPIGWDWDADDDEEVDFDDGTPPVPEPGLGQGMAILFLTAVVDLAISLVLAFVFEVDRPFRRGGEEWIAVRLFVLAGGFFLLTSFLAGMLPTTFRRAALVAFYFYLILITVGVLIAGLLYVALGIR
jgi:hypothetical protein